MLPPVRPQLEKLLTSSLFFAQACWVLRYFCELKFRSEANLVTAMSAIKTCLLSDKDLPVSVEAALAIQMLITEQEKGMLFSAFVHSYTHVLVQACICVYACMHPHTLMPSCEEGTVCFFPPPDIEESSNKNNMVNCLLLWFCVFACAASIHSQFSC